MSRRDLSPTDFAGLEQAAQERDKLDAWTASAHAELEPRKGWPSTSQMGLLRQQHDTLGQRLSNQYRAPSPWIGTVLVAAVVLSIAAAAAIAYATH